VTLKSPLIRMSLHVTVLLNCGCCNAVLLSRD